MREIPLTQGKVALVDDEDYEWLAQWRWTAWTSERNKTWYARRPIWKPERRKSSIAMHHLILPIQHGQTVDHKNGNGLDNQRHNLRLATNPENQCNAGPYSSNTSGYKGVCAVGPRWRAQLQVDGRKVHIGIFDVLEDAARAYDVAARELQGEFAYQNFPR